VTIGRLIDVSSAQHGDLSPGQGPPINWAAVAGAGVTAAFIKTTEGTTYVNPWYAIDVAGATKAGILTLGYHFARMGDPVAEAQFFKFHAGSRARVLDYETNTNVPWARTFLAELGLPPGELLTYGSLDPLGSFYAQLPSMAWIAAYGQGWPGFGVCWQFTDAASIAGIVGNVDEDQWHGDESQYEALFGVSDEGGFTVLAPTPSGNGYWTVNAQGALITHGDAQYLGGPNTSNTAPAGQPNKWDGPPVLQPGRKVVAITAHPGPEQGYWIEDDIGEIFAYGAAKYLPPN
jgi:hypothetical protein